MIGLRERKVGRLAMQSFCFFVDDFLTRREYNTESYVLGEKLIQKFLKIIFYMPSVWFGVTAFLVYYMQTLPLTRDFMLGLHANYWSIFLINAAFLSLIYEVRKKRLYKFFILLPVLYFGGYFIATTIAHIQLFQLRHGIKDTNVSQKILFDPQQDVFEIGSQYAEHLISAYDLPKIYTNYSVFPSFEYSVIKRISDTDQKIAAEYGRENGFITSGKNLVMYPEKPDEPVFRVIVSNEWDNQYRLLRVRKQTAQITSPNGERYTLKGGDAYPLKWLPMPVAGCKKHQSFFPSSADGWYCSFQFMRERKRHLVPTHNNKDHADASAIAQAVNLKPRLLGIDIDPMDVDAIAQSLKSHRDTYIQSIFYRFVQNPERYVREERSLYVLDKWLSDDVFLSNNAKDLWTAYLKIKSYEQTGKIKKQALEKSNIAHLIARLPYDAFSSLSPDMIKEFSNALENNDIDWLWDSRNIITRLGDVGEPAYALFEKIIEGSEFYKHRGSYPRFAVLGICRAGAPTANKMKVSLLDVLSKLPLGASFDHERRLVFVTLMRLGLEAESLDAIQKININNQIPEWVYKADLTTESPRSVCVSTNKEPNLPE